MEQSVKQVGAQKPMRLVYEAPAVIEREPLVGLLRIGSA